MDGKSVFVSLVGCLLLSACQKQPAPQLTEVQPQKPTPAQSVAVTPPAAIAPSPETAPSATTRSTAFEKVAAKLDAGGVSYLYWSVEKIFGELSKKFAPVADAAAADPDLSPSEKERMRKCFIRSSADFARLAAGMPENGNCVTYASKALQKTLADLQIRLSEVHESQSPLLEAITTKFARLSTDLASYGVGSVTDDGWIANGKATKDMNELVGEFASLPAYYLAIAALEYAKEGRQTSRLTKIKQNLANLQAAKEEAIAEKNFANGQILTRQDVGEYLAAWPDSVVGETYEVGAVGQPPYATAPVDVGNYPAGTKIEP
jgi:hypothetical protein